MRTALNCLLILIVCAAPLAAGDWPEWRGPNGTGQSADADPPTTWSETENVRWKTELPGRSHASPIVWKDRVYVLSAAPVDPEAAARAMEEMMKAREEARLARERGEQRPRSLSRLGVQPQPQRFVVMALDRATGKVVWEKVAAERTPPEGTHPDGTWASASPVTDGEMLYAHFGSNGLFAYDLNGNLKWQKDLGKMRTRNGFGEGASPAVYGDTLVINWDHEDDSYIAAFDKKTGAEKWKKERDEPTSWSTPLIVESAKRPQVVVAATGMSRGYDLANGNILWEIGGQTLNVVPSPIYAHGLVFLTSGFRGNMMQAVNLSKAKGAVADTEALAWQYEQDTPYVPSPLVYDDHIYFLKTYSAVLTVLNAKTGEVVYNRKRVDGLDNVYASIVGANGRVYIAGRNGTTTVLKHGDTYEVFAQNTLPEGIDASPAIAGKELYLRTRSHLYSLSESGAAKAGP